MAESSWFDEHVLTTAWLPILHQRYFSPQAFTSLLKPVPMRPTVLFTTDKTRFSGLMLEYFTQQAFLLEPHISVFKVLTGIARCSGCLRSSRHLHNYVTLDRRSCTDIVTKLNPAIHLPLTFGIMGVFSRLKIN